MVVGWFGSLVVGGGWVTEKGHHGLLKCRHGIVKQNAGEVGGLIATWPQPEERIMVMPNIFLCFSPASLRGLPINFRRWSPAGRGQVASSTQSRNAVAGS